MSSSLIPGTNLIKMALLSRFFGVIWRWDYAICWGPLFLEINYSFYNLLNNYNATSGSTGASNIVKLPLAFVRSGYVYLGGGNANDLGNYGYVWSRTSFSSAGAYRLNFGTSNVYPSNDYRRYYGFSLRCLYVWQV